MKMRENPKILLITLSVLVSIAVGLFLGRKLASERVLVQAQSTAPDGSILAQDLAQEGWAFVPVDPNNPQNAGVTQPFLSEQAATTQLNKLYPDYQKSPDLTGIASHLGLLSNSRLQASAQRGETVDPTFLKPRLVWIVTYEGIKEPMIGPEGANVNFSNEMNVVIDATSGKYLMDYVWTR